MKVDKLINEYIHSLPEAKGKELLELHELILSKQAACKRWFLDGKDEQGKVVSNPNIGYGHQTMHYANGKSREFYQVGISANSTGLSVYIMSIADKTYLAKTYATKIGKASITGYCIKFKRLSEIHIDVLLAAINDGFKA